MAKASGKQLLQRLARQAAVQQGVPPALFMALIQQESGWNPNAGSGAGARGLTQLMPGTARGLGVRDVMDPVQNLRGGARYLRKMLDAFGNDPRLALSAYNSGPGGVESSGRIEAFPETQAYVRNVMALENQYKGAGTGGMPSGAGAAAMATMAGAPGNDPGAPAGALGPVGPSAPELSALSKVGPLSAHAAQIIQGQEAQQAQTAATGPGGATGAQPDVGPGDAGPPPQTDGGTPAVAGLNAEFARRFGLLQKAIQQAGGHLTIYSGGRDQQKQAGLYKAALAKYGSESEARKWVAPPGKSNHDTHAGLKYGMGDGAVASDLRGDLAMAHNMAARYGLVFPLSNEAWHIELAGIRNMAK